MTKPKPLNPGPSSGPDPMASAYESVGYRMDRVERNLAELTNAVQNMGSKLDQLISGVERMERGIDKLIGGINEQTKAIEAQSETMKGFLKLAQQQASTVDRLIDAALARGAA